ncbi:MAG TPA: FGGY-family carbohydrate kinase [Candidatus Limnocylindrales bacterium]|jgi:sugar (pentulose or hexulose) kinase|nr:FGGY-family carbohydrate kinase [Candidatus Limnocylindrales bacterium]
MTAPPGDDLVLAIDVGTQSVRALLFDPRGMLVRGERIPIDPYVSPRPGWAEQDAELYWRSIREACGRLWSQPGGAADRDALAGLAITTQRGTIVVTDDAGQPLRPAIVWLDQRRVEGLPPVGGLMGLAFRALGVRDTVAAFQADCEANWIRVNEPETWARIRHYLFLSGFLVHRLTGRFVDSTAAQVGFVPFDYRTHRWAKAGDWKWHVAPVDPAWLAELVPPARPLGELTGAAGAALGLPAGLPVVAAAADKACEVLGSGAVEPHIAALSYGTAATVNTTHRRYVEAVPLVPPFPSAVPGAYSLEVSVYRGYWLVEWFRREFGEREVARAAELGVAPESLFDELVRETPPGSMGLLLQPTWSPGVRIPGPEARGAIIGFGDVHTRAHVYRAILEGLAYALREGAERSAARTKTPIREIRVSGGGSQSPAAVQLTADVFGLPAARPHTHETSGLGAAIDAAVGLGLHPDVESAAAAMTRVGEVHEPDAKNVALYDDLYRSVYRPLYGRLKPLYEEIRRITGYPAS